MENPSAAVPDGPSPPLSGPDRRNHARRNQLVQRVRAEFNELRGLTLTLRQGQRLFDVREDVCLRIFEALVDEGMLRRVRECAYARQQSDG